MQKRRRRLHKNAGAMLPGTVITFYARCGKAACHRCPHGPYHYRFWRAGGRAHKAYIRKRDVAAVRKACAVYAQQRYDERQIMRDALQYSRLGLRELRALLREVEGWERS